MMFYKKFMKNLKKLCKKKNIIKLIDNEFSVCLLRLCMTITILPYGITEMHRGKDR